MSDRHVHAVYDVAEQYPRTVCGWHALPGVHLAGEAALCRRCLAVLPDNAELRPACDERRRCLRLGGSGRRLAKRYDRRIARAIAEQWRHG